MSKDIFSKNNVIKIKGKNEIKLNEKLNDNNISLLNNFLKKKGVKVEVLQKKDLPNLRKANTPEIRKKKIVHLNTLNPNKFENEKGRKDKVIKTLETISAPSKKGRNNDPLSVYKPNQYNTKQIRTLNDRSCSEDSDASVASAKRNKNLTFDNSILNSVNNSKNFGNHEKIKIIDTMIDGLQRLKTLVIEEETKRNDKVFPKIIKKNNLNAEERKKISRSNEENKAANNSNYKIDKTMLEITKILETENENETPSEKKLNKQPFLINKNLKNKEETSHSSLQNSRYSNFFKAAIKRDSPITILNQFSNNVKLLTKDLFPQANTSLSNIRTSNDNSFLNHNSKIERTNAYTSCQNTGPFDNSFIKANSSNLVFKLMNNSNNKPIRLEISNEQNTSAMNINNNLFKMKDILNSNGCQNEILFEKRPVSLKKSFHLKEENVEKKQKNRKEINLLDSSEEKEKQELNLQKRESSSKEIPKDLEENNDITNYFKASFSNIDKEILFDKAKESNGANIEVGKYMKKINFFDESDGFIKNQQFID